jgi:hypothetical protein
MGNKDLAHQEQRNKTPSYQKYEEQGSCPPGTEKQDSYLPIKEKKYTYPPGAEEISFMPTRNRRYKTFAYQEQRKQDTCRKNKKTPNLRNI